MLLTRDTPPPPFAADPAFPAFRRDIVDGLSRFPKATPPLWFYDQRGSELFEAICDLPEYYPTRTETALLQTHGPDFADGIRLSRPASAAAGGGLQRRPRAPHDN
jgi:uncharacterized SAM-dependent methyltransferase